MHHWTTQNVDKNRCACANSGRRYCDNHGVREDQRWTFFNTTTDFIVVLIVTTIDVSDDINSYALIFLTVFLNFVHFNVAMNQLTSILFCKVK